MKLPRKLPVAKYSLKKNELLEAFCSVNDAARSGYKNLHYQLKNKNGLYPDCRFDYISKSEYNKYKKKDVKPQQTLEFWAELYSIIDYKIGLQIPQNTL